MIGINRKARTQVPNALSRRCLPQCFPITLQESLWNLRRSQTWYVFLAVISTSWPLFCNSSIIGKKKGTCGELSRSIQIFFPLPAVRADFSLKDFISVARFDGTLYEYPKYAPESSDASGASARKEVTSRAHLYCRTMEFFLSSVFLID